MSITINPKGEKQVMHSFGASDCWTCQFIGKNWPIEKRNAVADLLFSTETDKKGNPKGIGLSMWRFNLGAGSAEQGPASRIWSSWHRTECFQNADGTYDWTKQAGEQWFLNAAKARGVKYLLAFTVSPPVQYTANGIAHADKGRVGLNVREGAMPKFADFLVDVAAHFEKQGPALDYISPINEPQWGWDGNGQEGSPAGDSDIRGLAHLLGQALHDKGLPTKVAAGEAGALDYLTEAKNGSHSSDQIKALWGAASPDGLKGLPNVAHVLSGHSYFSTWPIRKLIDDRQKLARRFAEIDPTLAFWQTEFCILENSDELDHGHGRDLGMDTAIYVARVIHSDLSIANASHWSWWLAVSQSDYKDGLIYLDFTEPYQPGKRPGDTDPLQRNGRVLPSKLLWAMGNFSRFVRPGMVRVDVAYDDQRTLEDAAKTVMASAYVDKKTNKLAIVLINCAKEEQAIKLTDLKIKEDTFTTYTTSETSDLAKGSTKADAIALPARSVVTLVGTLASLAD